MGGRDAFVKALDENFDKGHYRHDNEPGHHYVYLYAHCDRLDKIQTRLPGILAANYRNSPDGLSGNDDLGQMSAWYISVSWASIRSLRLRASMRWEYRPLRSSSWPCRTATG